MYDSAGRNITVEESDAWRVGCPVLRLRAVGVFCDACLSFVSTGAREREKGIGRRERTCVAIARRMGRFCYGLIYSHICS